jgi:hypothetical protein
MMMMMMMIMVMARRERRERERERERKREREEKGREGEEKKSGGNGSDDLFFFSLSHYFSFYFCFTPFFHQNLGHGLIVHVFKGLNVSSMEEGEQGVKPPDDLLQELGQLIPHGLHLLPQLVALVFLSIQRLFGSLQLPLQCLGKKKRTKKEEVNTMNTNTQTHARTNGQQEEKGTLILRSASSARFSASVTRVFISD